jgi:hypothetical protein
MQPDGRVREVQFFRDRNEIAEMSEFHEWLQSGLSARLHQAEVDSAGPSQSPLQGIAEEFVRSNAVHPALYPKGWMSHPNKYWPGEAAAFIG